VVPYYPAPFPSGDLSALYRAVAQVGLGNNVSAGLPDLVRLIGQLKPREPEFYMVLGEALPAGGRKTEAYEQAVKLSSGGVRELLALAGSLQPDGAEEVFRRAVAQAPADPEPLYRYGLFDAAQGRLAPAIAKIRQAIALDPAMPYQQRNLAALLLRTGRADEALAAARDALRTDPYDDAGWDVAAKALTEKAAFAEAFFDFERALRLHPLAAYDYDYALALVRADRFEEAQTQAEAAIRADSGLASAHQLLGGLLLRRGDRAGAAEQWQAAARGNDPAVAAEALRLLRQAGLP
jgi:tetratricopeptide (TPR) repeat protein